MAVQENVGSRFTIHVAKKTLVRAIERSLHQVIPIGDFIS